MEISQKKWQGHFFAVQREYGGGVYMSRLYSKFAAPFEREMIDSIYLALAV